MSAAGIHGQLQHGLGRKLEVLVIGHGVPRFHHSDGKPVYQVVMDARGTEQLLKDGRTRRPLLAYPASWPAPGKRRPDRWILAVHENLTWEAPVPVFDVPA